MSKYEIVNIEKEVILHLEWKEFESTIDDYLDKGNHFPALYFKEGVNITAGWISYLIQKIRLLRSKNGEMVIVVPGKKLRELFFEVTSSANIKVYSSLEELSYSP